MPLLGAFLIMALACRLTCRLFMFPEIVFDELL
jgi:hypothetical protein